MKISQRGIEMPASPIRRLAPYANKAKEKGIKVYHLNIGDPDIPTPHEVFQGYKNFKEKVLPYGPSEGLPFLRNAIVEYFKRYQIDLTPDNIFITTGGSEAILFSILSICDYGDEIIVPEPFYTNYNGFAKIAGVKLVPITLKVEDNFHIKDTNIIKHYITTKTKAILICSPNNPTGTVYTFNEIKGIIDIALEYDIYVISDEVYREFTFDKRKHISVLQFKEAQERVIVVDSISKRFSACGARIGFIVTRNRDLWCTILKFGQARLCPPTFEQYAAAEGFKKIDTFMDNIVKEYEKRRNVVFEELRKIEGVVSLKPEGAFYNIVKLPVDDAEEFIKWMLTDFNVDGKTTMLAPASGFYSTPNTGLNEARIAYVLNENNLRDSLMILKAGLEKYGEIKGFKN